MQRDCSEETARLVDEEVKELLDQAYEEAIKVLESHRDQLEAVVSALLESETLDGNTFYEIIGLPLPEPPLS